MRARDRERFGEFMESRWPGLVRLGYALTGDGARAEDAARAALARTCAVWRRVSASDDPDSYARRSLITACTPTGHHRWLAGHALVGWRPVPRSRATAATQGTRGQRPPAPTLAPADAPCPDSLVSGLQRLPWRQRVIIALRYWDGLSDPQVAATMRCRPRTVRAEAAQALGTLAATVGDGNGSGWPGRRSAP